MKDCLAIDATGNCPSLATYGLPETWDTSQVTDMSFRALPRISTREGANPTLVAWFVSCVGPCTSWTVGGLRPVVWLRDGAAQCFAWGQLAATRRVRQHSTNPSDHGTCPRSQTRTSVRAYSSRGSTLHPAPCIHNTITPSAHGLPLCGDAIGGRSACGSAWSIVRSRGCCLAWDRARGGLWVG